MTTKRLSNLLIALFVLSGASAQVPKDNEDCITYNNAHLSVEQAPGRWRVVESGPDWKHVVASFDAEADAIQLLAIMRTFPIRCFIGRFSGIHEPYLVLQYWKSVGHSRVDINLSDCTSYDPNSLNISVRDDVKSTWMVRDSNRHISFEAHSSADAARIYQIASKHQTVVSWEEATAQISSGLG